LSIWDMTESEHEPSPELVTLGAGNQGK